MKGILAFIGFSLCIIGGVMIGHPLYLLKAPFSLMCLTIGGIFLAQMGIILLMVRPDTKF
jgi:hypothetical protein